MKISYEVVEDIKICEEEHHIDLSYPDKFYCGYSMTYSRKTNGVFVYSGQWKYFRCMSDAINYIERRKAA